MHSKARSKVVYLDFDWFWILSESLRKTLTNSDQPRPDCRWASQILLSSSCYRLNQVTIECWDAGDLKNGITCPWQCYRFDVRYHIDIIPSNSLEGFGFFTWWISPLIYGWQLSYRKKVAAFCFLPETLASMHNWERLGRFPRSTMVETATLATFFEVTVNDSFVAVPTQSEMIHMPVIAQKGLWESETARHLISCPRFLNGFRGPVGGSVGTDQMSRSPWCQMSWNQGSQFLWCSWWYQLYCVGCLPASAWILARLQLGPQKYCWRRLWSHFEYTFETFSLV